MPTTSQTLTVALGSVLFLTTVAMFTALFRGLKRLSAGQPLLPPGEVPRRNVPWGFGTVVLVIVTWFVVNLTVSSAYLLVRSHGRITSAAKPVSPVAKPRVKAKLTKSTPAPNLGFTEQMVLVSVINGVLIVALPFGLRRFRRASWHDLGLSRDRLGENIKTGAVAFLMVTPVVMAVNIVAQLAFKANRHPVEQMLRDEASPTLVALAYLSAVVLAPAAEELMFRVVIQGWLRRAYHERAPRVTLAEGEVETNGNSLIRWLPRFPSMVSTASDPVNDPAEDGREWTSSGVMPVILTSVFFAAVHFEQMPAPLAIFPLSIALGLLYEATGSVVPSLVLHALFNGFNTTVLVLFLVKNP